MGKDRGGALKAERAYEASNPLQRCVVCQRLFCRRRNRVCSRDCQAKLQEDQDSTPLGGS